MAKRSPQTFLKRQREMDKKRKAEFKRARRAERRDTESEGPAVIDQDQAFWEGGGSPQEG